MARITSYYHWNEDTAPWDEWDDEEGGFRCASATNSGITFECMSGSTPLNANAANIVSASWTARVATASGISRDKYYFNNFCVKLSSGWTNNIGSTSISNWTVSSSSGTGTISRSDGFRVPDGSISSPNSFKGVGGDEIRCRISIGNSTTSQITLLTEATLTIVWDEPEIVYTKPTVSLNAVNTNYAPSKSIKVSWTGTAGSNNNIAKYEYVYKTENASPTSSDTKVSTGTAAEANITTPTTTAGITTSKYFYVKPYGTNSNYNGSWTGPLTISSYYTNISWGKTFKIGGSTGTIYIGSKGSPKATLYWDTASSGTNNGISSYQFYKGSSIVSTYNKDSYALTVGQFKVVVVPEIGNSLTSNLITIKNLEGLSNPSFSSTLKTTIDKNFNFKITSLEKNNYSGVKSITQTVERIYNGVSKTIALTNNEGNCDVSDIPDNQTFTLKITATYNDNFGGYTNTTYTSATITKVKKIEVPEGFIQYIGEKDDSTTTGTDNKFFMTKFYIRYNNLNKGLTSVKYKYEMYYQIGNDAYVTNPITSSTNTSDTYGKFVFNSNLDHMGKLITFYIKITDNTTGSAAETEVFTIRSLKAPTIDSITANIKSSQNELVNFTINYKSNMDVSVGNMKLYVNFIYNGVKGKNTDYTYTLTTTEQSAAFPSKDVGDYYYSCISSNENIQNFYNSLLQEIYPSNGAGVYNPNLQLWIKIEYEDHSSCYTETIKGFDNWPHYLQETPTFTSNFLIENLKDFYNPLDTVTLSRGNLDLTKKRSDGIALTTARPHEIKYVLNYKNSNINFTNNQIEIFAPETVQDDIIQVGFITEVKYKKRDGTIISKQYNSSGGTTTEYVRFNLAKWNSNIVPYLSNCSQSNGRIEGKINFESDKIYSKKYYNLSSIKYVIYEELGANDVKLKEGLITINTLEVPISESFSFNYSNESNVNIYAIITYTNSSDKYFTHQTQTYLIRTENLVPLALRKKGIGINVEPTFDLSARGSAIYAAAANDDSAVIEIQASDEILNPKFFNFLQGSTLLGDIYFNKNTSLFHCDKWYYPVTKVNEKTGDENGNITLTAADVKARSNTWMPTAEEVATAGTGISISGKTISWSPTAGTGIDISGKTINNTGVTKVETSATNGNIKVTVNGEATEVKVAGLNTMAYQDKNSYLALSGGTLTNTLTGTTINANIFGGNAIRYGSSTPSNPVVGQIWLKPKK